MEISVDLKLPCLICGYDDVTTPIAEHTVSTKSSNFVDLRAKFGIKNDSTMFSDDTMFQIFLKVFKVNDTGGSNGVNGDVEDDDKQFKFCSICKIKLGSLLELQIRLDILTHQFISGLEHIKGKMEEIEGTLQLQKIYQCYPRYKRIRRKATQKEIQRKDDTTSFEPNTMISNQQSVSNNIVNQLEQELDSSSIPDLQDHNNSNSEEEPEDVQLPEQQTESVMKKIDQTERTFRKFVEDAENKLLIYGDKWNASFPAFTFHLLETSGESQAQVQCTHCDLVLPYNKEWIRGHVAKVHTNRFVCPHCPDRFSRGSALKLHVKRVHEGQSIIKFIDCKICGKPIPSGKRKNHEWTHKSKEEKEEAFKDPAAKTAEIPWNRKHDREKKIHCEKCDHRFSNLPSLKKHLERVHTDPEERRELCPECGKTFLNLRIHIRTKHTDNGGVVDLMKTCLEPGCGKKFLNLGALTQHKDQVHRKLRPWKCKECGKGFGKKWNLTQHVKVTHEK